MTTVRAVFVVVCVSALLTATSALGAEDEKAKFSTEAVTVDGHEVTIVRDSYGVPHVFADADEALYYGNGYAVAQDRLLQLEKYRRTATGNMAELMGEKFVESDRQTRLLGYTTDELQRQVDNLSPLYKLQVEAYTRGVNAWFDKVRAEGRVPKEFTEAGVELEPWRTTDTAAIGAWMARRFGGGGAEELKNLRLLGVLRERFGDDALKVFDDVLWLNDPGAPTTVWRGEGNPSPATKRHDGGVNLAWLPGNASDLAARRAVAEAELSPPMRERLAAAGIPTKWGSNAWVISAGMSASGNPLLYGGPQMGFSTPQIAHEVHLVGPEVNVIGMGFAGVPGVLIGHNEHLAWTTTSAVGDYSDVFAEKLNPDNKYQYMHNGEYTDMEKRVETIRVAGGDPVEMEIYRTVHGPVLEWDEEAGIAYAVAANFWMREVKTLEATGGFNRADNIEEFAQRAEHVTTSHNWFCATQDGDIGFWFTGKLPVRSPEVDRRLPTPGTGEYDWKGDVPFSEMPQVINPEHGYLVNWNNKPAPWLDNGDECTWGPFWPISEIGAEIEEMAPLSIAETAQLGLHAGTRTLIGAPFLPMILGAAERTDADKDPRLHEALEYLRAWNLFQWQGDVATTILETWMGLAAVTVLVDDFGPLMPTTMALDGEGGGGGGPQINLLAAVSLLVRTLQGEQATLPLKYDYLGGKDRDEVIVGALRSAVNVLEATRGKQMGKWSREPQWIELDPLPAIPNVSRGTYIQVVEAARPDINGMNILPPGQSEGPDSPHYSDQRELAGYWLFKPMLYKREDLLP
ncbi:MAG: penicillin acylase family protein [Armatimonadota bacterium]|nr:MAG: penicillin acylase family protein [Armatimonadota bacterium]